MTLLAHCTTRLGCCALPIAQRLSGGRPAIQAAINASRTQIQRWRFAVRKTLLSEFRLPRCRKALDIRDGYSAGKRAELYKLLL
jgi:hypothetical protein